MTHNLSGFDSHLLMKNLVGFDDYKVIPRNKEQMIGVIMTKKDGGERFGPEGWDTDTDGSEARECNEEALREVIGDTETKRDVKVSFRDSLTFLSGSLERNIELLKKSDHDFLHLQSSDICKTEGKFDNEKFQLLLRKGKSRVIILCCCYKLIFYFRTGIYPYEAMQGFDDLRRKEFPKREEFDSSLGAGTQITEADYQHGLRVWEKFQCKSMLDYSEIYVMLDTVRENVHDNSVYRDFYFQLQLLECWQPVCENTKDEFGLYPSHYFTLPRYEFQIPLYLL